MDFAQLMQTLEQALAVEHLTPNDDGEYVLEFDGWIEVRICLLDRSTVVLQSVVGREPDDECAAQDYLEKVLRHGVLHFKQAGDVASLDPDTDEVHLHRTLDLRSLTPQRLHEALEQFISSVERWLNLLAGERPPSRLAPSMLMVMP